MVANFHDLGNEKWAIDVVSDGDEFTTEKRLAVMRVETSVGVCFRFLSVVAAHVGDNALIASVRGVIGDGVRRSAKAVQYRAGATPGGDVLGPSTCR